MADGETKGCTFQWKIENVSNWWWLIHGKGIESPAFNIGKLKGVKWSLRLYPMGICSEKNIELYLKIDGALPDVVEVSYQLAFLSKDSSILSEENGSNGLTKNIFWGSPLIETRERVFFTEKEAFINEDTLIAQCTINNIDKKPVKSNHIFSTTVMKVKRKSYMWRIDKISSRKSEIRKKFKNNLICLDVVSNEDFDKLDMQMTLFEESIKYISCGISITDEKGKKENLGIKKYFPSYFWTKKSTELHFSILLLENKSKFFSKDILSLVFELVISTAVHLGCKSSVELNAKEVEKEKCPKTTNLNDDLKSMYIDGVFSDMQVRSSTKSYPVHMGILSSRSPVFRGMFSNDMKEKNCGHVDITDFEDDTIHRMLLYIYTDSLEDLQFERACNLYKIADKYQILSLKSRCSFFLKENLSPSIACGILVLADQCSDDDLVCAVQDYILGESKKLFSSQEWEDFMSTHLKLAAEIMRKKLTMNNTHME